MFSVVIPLYNKVQFINRTIQSVLNQTFSDFEIIIVDDGSIDGSSEVILKFSDPRIKIFHRKNEGVSSARNYGISKAKNEFIAFLDADDEWETNFLNEIKILIDNYPLFDVFATSFLYDSDKIGTKIANTTYILNDDKSLNYFRTYMINIPFCSSSVVVKTAVLNLINGFPDEVRRGEDLITWIKLALDYKIAYSQKVCAIYHTESDNRACLIPVTSNDRCFLIKFLESVLKKSKLYKPKNQDIKKFLDYFLVYNFKALIKEKEIKKIIYVFWLYIQNQI